MPDVQLIREDLGKMREYFLTCMTNAQPDSEQYRKYVSYIVTLTEVLVRIAKAEEGKHGPGL